MAEPSSINIFISYKSQNVNFVRRVAECLLAGNINVWFAEYNIFIDNYDEFKKEIIKGINKATHALVFSSDSWANSPHCCFEMETILDRLGLDQVIELPLEEGELTHQKFSRLENAPQVDCAGSFHDTMEQIFFCLELAPALFADALANDPCLAEPSFFDKLDYEFDVKCFREYDTEEEGYSLPHPANMAQLRGTINGHTVKLLVDITLHESAAGAAFPKPEKYERDDKALYISSMDFARKWKKKYNIEIKGLHLFHCESLGQMAITYYVRPERSDTIKWERRYILRMVNREYSEVDEVGLVFSTDLSGSHNEQLASFCSLCHVFDEIVNSCRYRGADEEDIGYLKHRFLRAKTRLLMLLVLAALAVSGFTNSQVMSCAAWALVGAALVDLLLMLTWRNYQFRIRIYSPLDSEADEHTKVSPEASLTLAWFFINATVLFKMVRNVFFPRGYRGAPGKTIVSFWRMWLVFLVCFFAWQLVGYTGMAGKPLYVLCATSGFIIGGLLVRWLVTNK